MPSFQKYGSEKRRRLNDLQNPKCKLPGIVHYDSSSHGVQLTAAAGRNFELVEAVAL
jgi:hypothetical protein